MATAPRIRTIRSSSPPSDGGLISSTINPTISAVSAAARSGGPMASLTYVRLERLAADGPGLRAHVLLQCDRNDRLGLVPVVDRVAARRLRGVFPARLHELERTAILAAAADRVRVLARLALGRLVRPMLVVARGLVPQPLVLAVAAAAAAAAAAAGAAARRGDASARRHGGRGHRDRGRADQGHDGHQGQDDLEFGRYRAP